jgi:excisionase family DNA binding protein
MAIQELGYSVKDAALLLGVSDPTIWRRIQSGELETYKVGSRRLVKSSSLLAMAGVSGSAEPDQQQREDVQTRRSG